MFIHLGFILLLAFASQQTPETQTIQFNITGYIVGIVYGFFDSIDYFEAWNCSQGIITFYTNLTKAIANIKGNTGGLQGTINFLNVIITILNSTINELMYCGSSSTSYSPWLKCSTICLYLHTILRTWQRI